MNHRFERVLFLLKWTRSFRTRFLFLAWLGLAWLSFAGCQGDWKKETGLGDRRHISHDGRWRRRDRGSQQFEWKWFVVVSLFVFGIPNHQFFVPSRGYVVVLLLLLLLQSNSPAGCLAGSGPTGIGSFD